MKFCILALVFLLIDTSYAGTEVHGGDLIVCYDRPLFNTDKSIDSDAKTIKLEVKDYWEGKRESYYQFKPHSPASSDPYEYVESILQFFWYLDFARAERLLERFTQNGPKSFKNQIKYVEHGELPEVDDTSSILNIAAGSNCYDRQLAVQKSGLGAGRPSIFIAKDLYQQLDVINQAGIILHELLLEDELKNNKNFKFGPNDRVLTDSVRFLNYLMVSDIYEQDTRFYDYLNIVKDQNLLYFDEVFFNFQDHLFKIDKVEFINSYPNVTGSYVKQYRLFNGSEYIHIQFPKPSNPLDGHSQFKLNKGSELSLSLSEYQVLRAKIVGDVDLQSSMFSGSSSQAIQTSGIQQAELEFRKGLFATSMTVTGGGEIRCQSSSHGEMDKPFSMVLSLSTSTVSLTSDDYILPCDRVKSSISGSD